ncbi:hypothetical protein GobsT_37770 [Gemmata obscuriglobus]|nr:hypothetical protein [Gemmata obscuriglobus]QEG28988.1 hypothetical protein GobsT_37770 [Gemmata obscuriglobus]VTS07551.1 unnamed protein product [Gemmata obscuriglobus UQM 2246]
MRWPFAVIALFTVLGCDTSRPTQRGAATSQPSSKKPNTNESKAPEWGPVLALAKKRVDIASGYGEAERLSVQAALSSRSAQALGGMSQGERSSCVDALLRVQKVGIERSDELSVQRAERVAPVTVGLLRVGPVPSRADREAVKRSASQFAGFSIRGDSGRTEAQLSRLPEPQLVAVGVNMELFQRASSPLASDYVLLQDVGLNQLAFASAAKAGMADGPEKPPLWHLARKQAGSASSAEQEAELLVRVWATSALLPAEERKAFAQRVASAAPKADFGPQDISAAALDSAGRER